MSFPFGSVGSVLQTACQIYDAVQKIKSAPETIHALQIEAARVRGLLTCMVETIGRDEGVYYASQDAAQLQPHLIEQARSLTEAVNRFLEKATKTKQDGTREVMSIMWLRNVSEAKDLTSRFQAFHAALSAVYAVTLRYVLCPFRTLPLA